MQRPNTRQTGPLQTPTPSFPSSPFSRGGKLIQPNAHENWFVAATVGLFGPKFTLFLLGLCLVLLSCLGPMLGFVGLSLAHLGTMLPPRVASGLRLLYFRFTLDHLGTSWSYVGPSWDYVGCCWGQCCAILALCWPILRPSWDYVGTMLGFVGSSWAYVGSCWDYVGRSWVLCLDILALCWPIFGPCCAVLGLCRTKKGHQSAKVVWKHVSKPVFHGICSVFYT